MTVNIDGLNVNYFDEGEGYPVLLLHGWGSSNIVYNGICSAISCKYRVIAPDFPGCGGSDTMTDAWDLENYCDFTVKFLNAIGIENPIMFGHSHGGRVVMHLTAKGYVNPPKIVLLDSAGLIPKKSFKQKFRVTSFKTVKALLTAPVIRNHSQNLLDKARRHYGSADYNSAPPVLRKTLVNLVNTDIRDELPNIKCPALLIWGDKDTATPLSDAEIIEKLIPDSGLCVIKGTGHFSFCERPFEAIAIVKSFLNV